jgi:hypothetical protein
MCSFEGAKKFLLYRRNRCLHDKKSSEFKKPHFLVLNSFVYPLKMYSRSSFLSICFPSKYPARQDDRNDIGTTTMSQLIPQMCVFLREASNDGETTKAVTFLGKGNNTNPHHHPIHPVVSSSTNCFVTPLFQCERILSVGWPM